LSDQQIGFDVARVTTSLKEHGVKDQDLAREIAMMREMQKTQYIEMQKSEETILKKIRSEQKAKATTNKSSAVTDIPLEERAALIALYNSTGGANWTNTKSNYKPWDITNPSSNVNAWQGITVSNGHVESVVLNSNNLTGSIPKEIKNLPYLRSLQLVHNFLTGEIPSEIGQLTKLYDLNLYNNQLSGTVPNWISNLKDLQNLYLGMNKLSGNIPVFGDLTKLLFLDLSANSLTGTIPIEIAQLKNLRELKLGLNQLTGEIPIEIATLSSLTWLVLNNNHLSGTIPSKIYELPKCGFYYLNYNDFTGSLPIDIGKNTNLYILSLGNNKLSGNIPASIGQLNILRLLDLSYNLFDGSIPNEIANCKGLFRLWLNNNQLTGNVNLNFQEFNTLYDIDISSNKLSGNVPDLTGQNSMKLINFSNNNFRFVDFVNQFSSYKAKQTTGFKYSPQAKIGVLETINKTAGQTVDFKMFADNDDRFHSEDTYQWFKDGVEISGAVGKVFTISTLLATDSGSYVCKSYHIANPDMSPLVLEREPITLKVVNCTPKTGELKLPTQQVFVGESANFSFEQTAGTVIS
ncbi:hypothetical protein, partial [Flavobacterium polysaccharolyticum]